MEYNNDIQACINILNLCTEGGLEKGKIYPPIEHRFNTSSCKTMYFPPTTSDVFYEDSDKVITFEMFKDSLREKLGDRLCIGENGVG